MDMGATGASRFARTRGRINGSFSKGINYPSPFFDIGHTYLPTTVKQMFQWCRYYFLVHPLINSVVFKLSLYPITDLVYHSDDQHLRELWKNVLEDHLKYRCFMGEIGLDYNTYGNGLVSIFYPFKKKLRCTNCKNVRPARQSKYYFRNFQFYWQCPRCGHHGPADVFDDYIKSPKGIRLLRWNPEDIDIRYNDLTGEYAYYYEIPVQLKNDIIMGKKSIVEEVPQIFIEALKKRKAIVFNKDNIYHFKRPTLAGKDRGWGVPLLLPVLKDAFYLQIMKKSQESVLLEHIVPLRVLFPQSGSATADPYCVSLDTLIETRSGLRPAVEVGEGDYLKSHTGAWRLVEAAVDREVKAEEDVYEFTVAGLTAFPFKISEEHPLLAVTRPKNFRGYDSLAEPDWIDSKDVHEKDFVCYPTKRITWDSLELDLHDYCPGRAITDRHIYRKLNQSSAEIYEYVEEQGVPKFKPSERKKFLDSYSWLNADYENAVATFQQQDRVDRRDRYLSINEELAYLLGIFAAEGSPKGTTLASLGLHINEEYIMDEIDRCADALGFHSCTRTFQGNSATVEINDVFLAALLVESCGRGSQNKHLPRYILEAPSSVAMTAVRATITGDGCAFCTSTKRTGLKTTSPQLAMDVRMILLSEGFIPTVQRNVPREDEIAKLPYYQVNLNGPQADLYEDGEEYRGDGQRRNRCGFIRDGYVYLRVRKREVDQEVKVVRGFQMSGDRSFCVAGVATHNSTINLGSWKDQISEEIQHWRFDSNYIPILSLPIGHQTIGGDGRALLLGQEIRMWSEHIITGMGVPQELIFGGLSFSGSNVSLRMLENMFLGYMTDHLHLVNWVIKNIASYMDWETIKVKFKPFKMADDLQRKAYNFQLNQAGKISDTTLLADADFDPDREDELVKSETDKRAEAQEKAQMAQAEIQGKSQMVVMRYQLKAQQEQMQMQQAGQPAPGEPGAEAEGVGPEGQAMPGAEGQMPQMPQQQGGAPLPQQQMAPQALPPVAQQSRAELPPAMTATQSPLMMGQEIEGGAEGGVNVDLLAQAQHVAQYLMQLDENSRTMALMNLRRQSPEFYQTVLGLMQNMMQGGSEAAAEPLPEQQAPQRGPGAAQV